MGEVIKFTTPEGPLLIETSESGEGPVRRGLHPTELTQEAADTFDSFVERLRGPIRAVLAAFENATDGIDQVELGMALSVRADAGIVVTKVGGEANFHVTVKWNRPRAAGSS
jgi:hypothetical protein